MTRFLGDRCDVSWSDPELNHPTGGFLLVHPRNEKWNDL